MSLRRISLKDFVIVDTLEVDVSNGFTALTGETGAGKSILIDAVQIALGQRADAGVIRHGANRCDIVIEVDGTPDLYDWLIESGLDGDAGDRHNHQLLLRRQIDAQGRSKAWINGFPATMTQLRHVGDALVDIHGQHAWQSLSRPASQRALLDGYAGINTTKLAELWQAWRDSENTLTEATAKQATLAQDAERLSWQITELGKLAPKADELEALNAEHNRQSHAQALIEAAQLGADALEDGDHNASGLIHKTIVALEKHTDIEPQFTPLVEVLQQAQALIEDATHSLHLYGRHNDLDPAEFRVLDERVSNWLSHARLLKCEPETLPQRLSAWEAELASLNEAADIEGLKKQVAANLKQVMAEAKVVHEAREKAARRLSTEITTAMQTLGMDGGLFEVAIELLETPQQHGLDDIEFLVAGHAGTPPRPVNKVASGGELSRIALAIAVCTSRLGEAPTLIFDEVDSGIGGQVAQTVGQLMHRLGRDRQVLAVTHLAQVAASADNHWVVKKARQSDQTVSEVHPVAGDARTQEIARMLGGDVQSKTSLAHASEMLAKGQTA